eukprot:symbB.v1.2.036618.t1/scaffold5211.1/size29781/1
MTVQGFRDVGATEQGIRREVQSMMLDPMTDWNSSSLPVPGVETSSESEPEKDTGMPPVKRLSLMMPPKGKLSISSR